MSSIWRAWNRMLYRIRISTTCPLRPSIFFGDKSQNNQGFLIAIRIEEFEGMIHVPRITRSTRVKSTLSPKQPAEFLPTTRKIRSALFGHLLPPDNSQEGHPKLDFKRRQDEVRSGFRRSHLRHWKRSHWYVTALHCPLFFFCSLQYISSYAWIFADRTWLQLLPRVCCWRRSVSR